MPQNIPKQIFRHIYGMRLDEYKLFREIARLIRESFNKGTVRQVYIDEKNKSMRAESKNYTWEFKLIGRKD